MNRSLLLLLAFIPFLAFSQEQIDKRGSDPLQGSQKIDSASVTQLLKLGDSLRGISQAEAMDAYRSAIEQADEINFENAKALGFKGIGLIKWGQSDMAGAEEYHMRSLAVFEKIADTGGIANIQNNLGAIFLTQSNYTKALEYLIPARRNAEIARDTIRLGSVYLNMGSVYSYDETTWDQAEQSYMGAIETFEELDDSEPIKFEGLAIASANLGEINLKRNEYDKSIPYLEESIRFYRQIDGDVAASMNWMAEAYMGLKDYKQAEQIYSQALEEAERKNSQIQQARAYVGLGNTWLEQGSYSRAIPSFEQGFEIAKEINFPEEQEEAARGIARGHAGMRDYEKAYAFQQVYDEIRDTVRNRNVADQLSKMQLLFDTERKEQEIELLNAQNSLNELQIEKDARSKQLMQVIIGLFLAIIAGFVFQFFYIRRTNRRLAFERNRSDQILLNILPQEVAEELKEKGYTEAREFDNITVLFTDFKAFSLVAERVSAEKLVKSVDYYFKNFDEITERHGLEKIKTIGDAYMCAGGIPTPNTTQARSAFEAALEILRFVKETEINPPKGIYPFQIRLGLNSGPVVAGVVGTKKFAYDIWGNTVNIAARMESGSVPGRINVSENIYNVLKDDYDFTYRGELEVKNQVFKMYFAELPEAVPA